PGNLYLAVDENVNTVQSENVHRLIIVSFLDQLHVKYRLSIHDQRAMNGESKTPDQSAQLPRLSPQLSALHRHIGHTNRRAEPAFSSGPCFAHRFARRLHHRVVNFFKLHARPAHPDERDERSQYFVCALAELIDARIAHHSLQREIGEVRRAPKNLEHVIDALPEPLRREHLQHCGLKHVIFQATIDERPCHRSHRFHRISVGGDPGDFLLHQLEFAQCLVELFPRVRVLDGHFQTGFRCAGAASAERRAPEIKHRQRHLKTFAYWPENIFLWHFDVAQREPSSRRAADSHLRHARLQYFEPRHVRRYKK